MRRQTALQYRIWSQSFAARRVKAIISPHTAQTLAEKLSILTSSFRRNTTFGFTSAIETSLDLDRNIPRSAATAYSVARLGGDTTSFDPFRCCKVTGNFASSFWCQQKSPELNMMKGSAFLVGDRRSGSDADRRPGSPGNSRVARLSRLCACQGWTRPCRPPPSAVGFACTEGCGPESSLHRDYSLPEHDFIQDSAALSGQSGNGAADQEFGSLECARDGDPGEQNSGRHRRPHLHVRFRRHPL